MRNKLLYFLLLCLIVLPIESCSKKQQLPADHAASISYPDGIYRGQYWDSDFPQIVLEFELKNNTFVSLDYKILQYKGADYLSSKQNQLHTNITLQFKELLSHLNGESIQTLYDLYTPDDIITDYDAVTSATLKSSKVISAIWDGLIRGPYQLTDSTLLPEHPSVPNGIYRGFTLTVGARPLLLTFEIEDGAFKDFSILSSNPEQSYDSYLTKLRNQPVNTLNELYKAKTSTASALLSAINYGIHCGIYKNTNSENSLVLPSYEDGTYRGYFYGPNNENIAIQFTIKNHCYQAFTYRSLSFQKNNYLSNTATLDEQHISSYYVSFIQSLSGKPLEAIYNIEDSILVDAVSGVTINGKGLSASILDGLNHHPYNINTTPVFPTRYQYADGFYTASYPGSGSDRLFELNFYLKNNMFQNISISFDKTEGALKPLLSQLDGHHISYLHRISIKPNDSMLRDQLCFAIWNALDQPNERRK